MAEQSMRQRNRVGKGLSYRPARLQANKLGKTSVKAGLLALATLWHDLKGVK
jgi:hypothetical protein